jgi:hypothetical protein
MTAEQLSTRLLDRLGERATATRHSFAEALAAFNEGQRLFVLLTLCLENTGGLTLQATQSWYRVLSSHPDFLLPLRVRVAGTGGGKVDFARLEEMDALNPEWESEPGLPERYTVLGFDLLAVHPRPAGPGASLDLTFARCPVKLTGSESTPEIPEEYHAALIDYAIPTLKAKDGGAEFTAALKHLDRFLTAAQKMGDFVRARNKAAQYDRTPFELASFDRSKLVATLQKKGKGRNG